MLDLIGNLPAVLGVLVALVVAFFGYGLKERRRGKKEGKDDAFKDFEDADRAEADAIRRAAARARLKRVQPGDTRGFRDGDG